jgi:hypothetical protein
MDIILKYFIYGILLFLIKECRAIKINRMLVPSRYELKDDNHPLVLDCDYTVEENAKGFVLKWHRDSVQIFQWIPSQQPFALGVFKGRLNLTHETESSNRLKKHSALVILKPSTSDSGNYTCNVQSYDSFDKKTAEMIVYDPADSVDLKYTIDQLDQVVNLECVVTNIYPYPEIKFLFDDVEKPLQVKSENRTGEHNYNVTISAQINKSDISDDSELSCLVQIPNTEYERKEAITYDENFAHRIASSLNLLIIVMIAVILGR